MRGARSSLLALVVAVAPASAAPEDAAAVMRVAYHGELFDEASQPISGVFPLTFEILGPAGGPIWTERQFVSVYAGEYDLFLGRTTGVPRAYSGSEQTIRVSLGPATVAEHRYRLDAWTPADERLPAIAVVGPVDLAGRAVRADRALLAGSCRRLGGRSLEQLDHSVDLRTRLDELRARINRPSGSRLGTPTVTLPRAGGDGGLEYERNCPAGFVMTGARGGAGDLIDSFRPICTQLE